MIRDLVIREMQLLGADRLDIASLRRTILREEGRPAAVIFRAGSLSAIWNWQRGDVRFYDQRANRLKTVRCSFVPS